MDIGIGLPNPVPDTPGPLFIEWAQRAESRGFKALATIDRIVYPGHDSLTVLAAAAGATSRIGLLTNILLGPAYPPALLAKATASLASVSGGRFTLGLAAGGRADDFAVTGSDFTGRGRIFDDELELLRRAWKGEPVAGADRAITPSLDSERVPILIGGTVRKSVERAVRFGDGWAAGGAPPEAVAPMAERVRAAWKEAGPDRGAAHLRARLLLARSRRGTGFPVIPPRLLRVPRRLGGADRAQCPAHRAGGRRRSRGLRPGGRDGVVLRPDLRLHRAGGQARRRRTSLTWFTETALAEQRHTAQNDAPAACRRRRQFTTAAEIGCGDGGGVGEDWRITAACEPVRRGGSALVVDPIEVLVFAQSSPKWRPALTRAA